MFSNVDYPSSRLKSRPELTNHDASRPLKKPSLIPASDYNSEGVAELVRRLSDAGIILELDGGSIVCKGPKDLLTEGMRRMIADNKPALRQFLRHRSNTESSALDNQLSYSQERLWLADQLETERVQFLLPHYLRIKGDLDKTAFSDTLIEIVRRHHVLRTNFPVENGRPTRVIAEQGAQLLTEVDLRKEYQLSGDKAARNFIARIQSDGLDICNGPVFRTWLLTLEDNHYIVAFVWHHIVFDGYSLGVFLAEFESLYSAFKQGKPSPLPEIQVQYDAIARAQRRKLMQGGSEKQLKYWRKQLQNSPDVELPRDVDHRATRSSKGKSVSIHLSDSLGKEIAELSLSRHVTPFMTLYAAFSVLLSRHTNTDDVVIGSPVAGRTDTDSMPLVGCFLNTLVLRCNLAGNPTFGELLTTTRNVCLEAFEAQDVPYEAVMNDVQASLDGGRKPLFNIFFNLLYGEESTFALPDLQIEPFRVEHGAAKFDLTLYLAVKPSGIRIQAAYSSDLYTHEHISELLGQFEQLLVQVVQNPDAPVASYTLVTPTSQPVLPDPTSPLDDTWFGPVHEIFSTNAFRHPNKIAVMDRSGTTTYGELDETSNILANALAAETVSIGDVVAIFAHRSASLVWAILSVMKTGASFLVIDPSYPAKRIKSYLEAASASAIISFAESGEMNPDVLEWIDHSAVRVRYELPVLSDSDNFLATLDAPDTAPLIDVQQHDQAYIAFTSGSTGVPKAISGGHSSLTHFERWMQDRFELSPDDRVSMLSGLSHDPLHREVFSGLYRGATIVVPDSSQIAGQRLATWVGANKLNVLNLTPAMARIMTNVREDFVVKSVRQIVLVGEELTLDTVTALQRVFPQATILNTYGATETQRAVAFFEIPAATTTDTHQDGLHLKSRIPVGRGMKNVQLILLNEADVQCGMYEIGEICIRSPHIALGYTGDDDATEQRFIPNPFAESDPSTSLPTRLADRMYRTGDFGYYDANGDVNYDGRKDGQISIRGYRIERAEIESVLRSSSDVTYAAVDFRPDRSGAQSVVAYVVPATGSHLSIPSLMASLKAQLPRYMVPASVVTLEQLPVSPNGKIIYDDLPPPDWERDRITENFVAPTSEIERRLAAIWCEILDIKRVGVEDDFFDLGGHSMMALRLSDRIASSCDVVLSLIDLFDATTISAQAILLEERKTNARSSDPIRTSPHPIVPGSPNLFLVPGLGGYGVVFADLAARLSDDLNVYTLSSPGLDGDGDGEAISSMSALARFYISEIERNQPSGPINLVGYSFGGQVTYEIARVLRENDREINYLAAIDSMAPVSLHHLGLSSKFVRLARFHLLKIGARVSRSIKSMRPFQIQGADKERRLSILPDFDFRDTTPDQAVPAGSMSKRLRVTIEAHNLAIRSYRPVPYPGRMDLLQSSIQRKRLLRGRWYSLYQWSDHVSDLNVIEIEGTHNDVIKEPKVAALADVIAKGIRSNSVSNGTSSG